MSVGVAELSFKDLKLTAFNFLVIFFANCKDTKPLDNIAGGQAVIVSLQEKPQRVLALQTKHLTFVTPYPALSGQRLALLELKYRQCDIMCTRDRSPKIEGDTSNWSALRRDCSCSLVGELKAAYFYRRQFS